MGPRGQTPLKNPSTPGSLGQNEGSLSIYEASAVVAFGLAVVAFGLADLSTLSLRPCRFSYFSVQKENDHFGALSNFYHLISQRFDYVGRSRNHCLAKQS